MKRSSDRRSYEIRNKNVKIKKKIYWPASTVPISWFVYWPQPTCRVPNLVRHRQGPLAQSFPSSGWFSCPTLWIVRPKRIWDEYRKHTKSEIKSFRTRRTVAETPEPLSSTWPWARNRRLGVALPTPLRSRKLTYPTHKVVLCNRAQAPSTNFSPYV